MQSGEMIRALNGVHVARVDNPGYLNDPQGKQM